MIDRTDGAHIRMLEIASRFAAAWALLYALYRFYYAAGGTIGMLGTPASRTQWVFINGAAAGMLFIAACLPIAIRPLWRSRPGRSVALVLCWIVTVACVSHATIGIGQRISSLSGVLTIDYPFWQAIDRRKADLQALFFNEPWFLGEGLAWGAVAWTGGLAGSPRRRLWIGSVVAAVIVSTTIGLLSAFGVIGKVIVG